MTISTQQGKPASTQSIRDEISIRGIVDNIHRGHREKKAPSIAAPYEENAAIFNLAPPLRHVGVDTQEKQIWLDGWATPIDLEARDVEITICGDMAIWYGLLRMRGTKKGSEGNIDFWMRETLCFKRQAGCWRIVHEHTSVPFYMDGTLRPAFDLQP